MSTLLKWSIEDYHRIVEAGILKDRSAELLEGEIVEMSPIGPLHRYINVIIAKYLRSLLATLAEVYEAYPVTLGNSEPQPDIAIVKSPDSRYIKRHPYAEDIYFIVEISDSTIKKDKMRKKKTYARNGIEEYWVVDVKGRKVTIFQQPDNDSYRVRTEYTRENISPLSFPEVSIDIAQIWEQLP